MRRETADQSDGLSSVKVFFMGGVACADFIPACDAKNLINNQHNMKSKNLLIKVQLKEDYGFSYSKRRLFKNAVSLSSEFLI